MSNAARKSVLPDASPALPASGGGGRTEARRFVSLAELLNTRPADGENARIASTAIEAGRTVIHQMAQSFDQFDGAIPVMDERTASYARKGLDITLDRTIGSLADGYGYALAFADAAAAELGAYLQTEERDRPGVYGFAAKVQQLIERAAERDAQAAWLCDMISGATEAFEEVTGTAWKPRLRDTGGQARTAKALDQVATSAAAFLARRKAA